MSGGMELRVVRAGPLALLQDAGRFGVRRFGVTQGGPADIHAWASANQLLGNDWGAAALEVTIGGLSLVVTGETSLALAGADMEVTLDNIPLSSWSSFKVSPGQVLSFGAPVCGVRAYLAVPGGFLAKPVLGSVASVTREELGGHDGWGGQLKVGDSLAFEGRLQERRSLPIEQRPDYSTPTMLGLVPGAQIAEFDGQSLFAAFNQAWRVDARADRMGVRLNGPPLHCRVGSMISEGIGLGAIQVPPDGQPIVLLNDRQTIGGYPRLGTLTPLACARLAQCQPGHVVYFRAQGVTWAQSEYRRFLSQFQKSVR